MLGARSRFKPGGQLRILGALQRPWELRPFYASSIGAGSFVPLVSPFTGAAMAGQHPAAPGGTDGMHPTAADGKPSPFEPILLAVWDQSKASKGQERPKKVPLALLSRGVSVHEIGTLCTAKHGPDCPVLKQIARSREMAVMLAAVREEPSMQWWSASYSLDRAVQIFVRQLPVWRSEYGVDLHQLAAPVATVASTLRARAGGSNASTTAAAVAAQAAEERTKQALERVAAAQAAGEDTPQFVSIGRGFCRAPNDGKTHYTYRCFPHCRGTDQIDLKTCEALCTQNCTAISHRQSDGRCVLYYGGMFRAFKNEVGWQHQKGSSGNEDPGRIVAASATQGVDHACLTRIATPLFQLSDTDKAQRLRHHAALNDPYAKQTFVLLRPSADEVASQPDVPIKGRIIQLNAPTTGQHEQSPDALGAGPAAGEGAEAVDRRTWLKVKDARLSTANENALGMPLVDQLGALSHDEDGKDEKGCSDAFTVAFASTLPGGVCAPASASRVSSSQACPAACQDHITSVKQKCAGFTSTMKDGKEVIFLCPAMNVLGNATSANCDVRPLAPSERTNYCD